MKYLLIGVIGLFGLMGQSFAADDLDVKITGKMGSLTVQTEDGPVKIMRNQDKKNTIDSKYAKTSRKCPPFCAQPMQVAPGVVTVGEVELLNHLKAGGKLIDSRTENWHVDGTIPSAINIPFTEMASRLNEVGCTRGKDKKWNCSKAQTLVLFCNGPWCGQSPMAIKAMIREGYPTDKILYYRGGMQAWHVFGLTVIEGKF